MNSLKSLYIIFFLLVFTTTSSFAKDKIKYYQIPEQVLEIFTLMGYDKLHEKDTIPSFEISPFITLLDYKIYLKQTKRDSSAEFYRSQLPSDKLLSAEIWTEYITNPIYESFPAIGVSWESAMNYCKWKTTKENKDSIEFIYLLPRCSEWVAANYYLNQNQIQHDLNKNYSDWLMNTKDETPFEWSLGDNFPLDYLYFHRAIDPPSMKRKIVIGNSYLYSLPSLIRFHRYNYYANEGYRHIGFRIVRQDLKTSSESEKKSALHILYYWNLILR